MSYSDPSAAYVPPPPPARGRSPWMFVGIGCGGLILLVVVALAVFFGNLSKSIQAEMQKPYDKVAVMKSLGDAPMYPKGQFDEQLSKVLRASLGTFKWAMPANEVVAIAYITTDTPDQIMQWYDTAMEQKGYTPTTSGTMPMQTSVKQNQYKKGNDRVMVQAQPVQRGEMAGKTMISIMRFNGFKGKD